MTVFLVNFLIVVPVIFLVFNLGRARGRDEERARRPETPKPICPCAHVWGEHKDGGRCQAQVRRQHYTHLGDRSGYQWVPCVCTKYHGPIPVADDFFHPGYTTLGEINQ